MAQKPSDWSIKHFYKEAWQIVKTHKVLWLFGIAAGASTGFNLSDIPFERLFPNTSQQENNSILGNSTSVLVENLSYLFSAIPLWVYALLILEAVILFLIMIGLAIVFQHWATASLLDGISNAIHKRPVSIKSSSERGFASIIPLIQVTLIPYLLLGAGAMLVFILLFLGFSLAGPSVQGLFGLLLFIAVVAFFIIFLLLTLTLIWAVRLVVNDHVPPRPALSHGFTLAKAHFWRMLGLGIVNSLMSILVFVVPIAILSGIFLAGFLTYDANKSLIGSLLGIGGMLILLFVLAIQLLSGILTAFKATVWTLAYHIVHKKHD